MESTKVCGRCKVEKPLAFFSRDKRRKDGFHSECKKCFADYYQATKEAHNATRVRWRHANPDKVAAQQRRASVLHGAEHRKRYKAAHPEAVRAHNRRHSKRVRLKIYQRDRWKCQICGKRVTQQEATLDHIVPTAMNGNNQQANLQLAHRSCNSRRGAGRIPAQTRFGMA